MQTSNSSDSGRHSHVFDEGNPLAERNTRWVVLLTAVTMIAEIIGGWIYNSMALLADGWHMGSHALALGLSVLAYGAARRFSSDPRFSFGTWKIEILGGYTSALFLVAVAGLMIYHSIERLLLPTPIAYNQAIAIALFGLVINIVCAWLLNLGQTGHHHGHSHNHHGGHEHHDGHSHHHDLNLRSAYLHVVTDAFTSVLAIVALFGGKLWGASWLDPVMGIAGGVLIIVWAYGLLRDTSKVLLDAEMDAPVTQEIRDVIASSDIDADITDLHVWRVGKAKYACILSLATDDIVTPHDIRQQLAVHEELVHVTVEINQHESIVIKK